MTKIVVNGVEINEYTYRYDDPRNPFTQPKEVCGVDLEKEAAQYKVSEKTIYRVRWGQRTES